MFHFLWGGGPEVGAGGRWFRLSREGGRFSRKCQHNSNLWKLLDLIPSVHIFVLEGKNAIYRPIDLHSQFIFRDEKTTSGRTRVF